jgi:hypothetical protein
MTRFFLHKVLNFGNNMIKYSKAKEKIAKLKRKRRSFIWKEK